jgi:hypothetical protein
MTVIRGQEQLKGRGRLSVEALTLFVFVLSACGARTLPAEDDEVVASCEVATPCGGDLVGRWEAVELCADLSHLLALSECETSSVSNVAPQIAGFRSYAPDGTYQIAITYGGSVTLGWPSVCAEGALGVTSCQRFGRGLLERGQQILRSAECAPRGVECVCDLVLLPFERRSTGLWTASASGRLSETNGAVSNYCVEGDELRLTTSESLGGLETVVLTRR